jgi:hypothetical protein
LAFVLRITTLGRGVDTLIKVSQEKSYFYAFDLRRQTRLERCIQRRTAEVLILEQYKFQYSR